MSISLSVKIKIKDFFPKNENISYDNYVCLFSYNNFNGKIYLKNINNQNQNSINHKVENFNSNIIYGIHLFDANKNSLVGISQLIIYFDKIKNLNVNDKLIQEERVKLIMDSKTKRKIFNKIYNIGDIFLNLLIEIKIIDKSSLESNKRHYIDYSIEEKELYYNTNNINDNIFEFNNLTPRNYQKKEDIKSIKKGRETIKREDTFSDYKDLNLDDLTEESLKNSTTSSLLQKNKSLQKLNKKAINKKYKKSFTNNNNKSNNINDIFKRHRSINSCTEIPLSLHNKTNYNLCYNKEDKKKRLLPKSYRKNQIPKKKVTILNLMEEKMKPILYKPNPKDVNYYELNNQSKEFRDFKNTSINFSKIQINKINDNLKKYSSRTVNKHKSFKSKEKIKKNLIQEIEHNQKVKNVPKTRKIMVNIIEKNKDSVKDTNTLSSHKSENGREIKCKKIKKISICNTGRLNTEMNMNKLELKNINNNLNLNSAILQTEINNNRKLSDMKISLRKKKNTHILTDLDLEQLIIEKGATIKGNFQNNCLRRGAFSPKLQLKFKFNENALSNNKNDITDYKFEQDKNTYRYKDKISTKILTPKANQKKLNSFNNNLCVEDNYYLEKEEIKKRYVNLIDFYSLLSKKMKKNNKNNIEITKNFENIKEKYTYLQKQKNKLIQKLNTNESKRIKNKAFLHFEQEQLFDKIMNIKIKENSVYQNIFGPEYGSIEMQNKIEDLILQKKELMLNLIKNIVKFYGNISQIYNNDINKKNVLKTLLNKYNIKEKVKIDLNYISHIHKENNFEDKIITEVDEEKENEEDEEENKIQRDGENNNEQIITNENNINENNNNYSNKKILDNNIEKDTYNEKDNSQDMAINTYNDYDENLNNLIKTILTEQFPENYKTNMRFNHIEKNKYSFGNKIFLGYIVDNDVVLKEEINENKISDNKYTLNEFYHKFCFEEKRNFVYTKKIRQKYIKIKNNNDKEQSVDKKPKNENSTTISDNEKRQQSILSKLNDLGEMKNSMSDEKETV